MKFQHLKFHHFGLAVRQADSAGVFLAAQGYEIGETVFDPEQNVNLAMGVHPTEPAVELIWPASDQGPVDRLVRRHTSGIVYHLCYETQNLAAALAEFEAAGLNPVCVSPPKPALLFGGLKVSFYTVIGIGLIEILEV